ncbi:hypothetical protein [Herbidospora sp. RD11066]
MAYTVDLHGHLPDGSEGLEGRMILTGKGDDGEPVTLTIVVTEKRIVESRSDIGDRPVNRPANVRAWALARVTELEKDGWRLNGIYSRRVTLF